MCMCVYVCACVCVCVCMCVCECVCVQFMWGIFTANNIYRLYTIVFVITKMKS